MKNSNFFHKEDLIKILNSTVDRTLGEVDVNLVFNKTMNKPKITGIAGDVIEQSVLGYMADRDQRPDLDIDGVLTELKTTGMRAKEVDNELVYEAKEPASITAVSIGSIEDEEFETSSFWHKIANLLFVFYEYESKKTVRASEYRNFHIRGYTFYSFKEDDLDIIRNDWEIIHDFLIYIRNNYTQEEAKLEYPNLSTIINKQTVYLDTAPKYPHHPRFRLRKRVVSSIIQQSFNGKSFEKLPDHYYSYADIERKCGDLTQLYEGLSMYELLKYFGVEVSKDKGATKQYAEQVIVRMFGGTSKKISKIEMFNKFGIIGKAVAVTEKGNRTEDMKLFSVDFDDLSEKEVIDEETGLIRNKQFEDSELYKYLSENKMLCIMFREVPDRTGQVHLKDNIFLGFKLLDLWSDEIIDAAKETWDKAHHLMVYDELKVEPIYLNDGSIRYTPKTKVPMNAPNLPKSRDFTFFFRGSGADATDKVVIDGLEMLRQNYWVKGKFVVEKLGETSPIYKSNTNRITEQRKRIINIIKGE